MRHFTPKATENYRALHTVYLLSGPLSLSLRRRKKEEEEEEDKREWRGCSTRWENFPPQTKTAPLTPAALGFSAALVGGGGDLVHTCTNAKLQLGHVTAESFFSRGPAAIRDPRPRPPDPLAKTTDGVSSRVRREGRNAVTTLPAVPLEGHSLPSAFFKSSSGCVLRKAKRGERMFRRPFIPL